MQNKNPLPIPQGMFQITSDRQYSTKETITPEIAFYILDNHNTMNRSVVDSEVTKLADQMKRGLWEINGEAIIFSKEGVLMDGQTRLWGCVESKTSFETFVQRGINEKFCHTIDTGRKRTPGDTLTIYSKANKKPIKNAAQLSAAITMCIEYQKGTLKSKGRGEAKMSRADIIGFYENYPEIEEWMKLTKVKKTRVGQYSAIFAAIGFLVRKKHAEKAKEFIEGAIIGDMIPKTSPIYVLREKLIEKLMYKWQRFSMVVLAFNAFIEGRTISRLTVRDEIPIILGTEDETSFKTKPRASMIKEMKPRAKAPVKKATRGDSKTSR